MSYNKIMKILICTGIYPPDIGGPAIYAKNLAEEFSRRGYEVKILSYRLEKKLPIGIRHCLYFLRTLFSLFKTDLIIALDTFSVGLPAVLAAKICGKKIIIRTGGDFLWESYVEKTGNLITLKDFYAKMPALSAKIKFIFKFSKFVLRNCDALVFSTKLQKDIFETNYELNQQKSFVIENFYSAKNMIFKETGAEKPKEKIFLWAGRRIKLKNIAMLESAFEEARKQNGDIKLELSEKVSYDKLIEKIKNCYAVILPSLTEISPNFIFDAASANKPFILTKETGFYEKLKDIGIFVNPLDREDIKNKILFLADSKNYDVYKEKIVNFNFTHSWKEIADEFLNICKRMPARGGFAFGGRILMISRDKNIFNPNSEANQRMIEYGKLAEKLYIMVLKQPFKLLKIGKNIKGFDLITAQDPFECGLLGYAIAKTFGVSLQLQIHTDFLSPYFAEESLMNRMRVFIAKFLIPHADCVRVVSERIKKSLVAGGYTQKSIIALPIFVDVETIKNAAAKVNFHDKYQQFDIVILMASRLSKEKNIGLAIQVMEEIVKKYPKTGLIIVGGGPEEQNLKSQILSLKISENIKMESWTNDIVSYYKTADLFLLASNYEGYGRTLIEATAAGCKIISSDVGIADEILPKENIFKVGDKNNLKEKIEKAIKGEIQSAKALSQQTKEDYLQEYKKSWEKCVY